MLGHSSSSGLLPVLTSSATLLRPLISVSIIVPLYNGYTLTRAMLASLQDTLPPSLNHEIILIDDGSTDGTREWLRSLRGSQIRIILNEHRLGYAGANNRAAALANGKFVLMLNNDLVLLPGWFEPLFDLATERALGIVGNVQISVRTRLIDHAGVFFDAAGAPVHFRPSFEFLGVHPVIIAPAVSGAVLIMQRRLFLDLGGFDEGYRNGYEDIDLCLRAASAGWQIAIAARSAAYHYISSAPGRHDAENDNAYRFAARWGGVARELAKCVPIPAESQAVADGLPIPLAFGHESYATFQVFHPASGGHTEAHSSVHAYPIGRWVRIRVLLAFGLTDGQVSLRLDPCDFPSRVRIVDVSVRIAESRLRLWRVRGAEDISAAFSIAGTAESFPEGDRYLSIKCFGHDPQLVLRPSVIPDEIKGRLDLTAEVWLQTCDRL